MTTNDHLPDPQSLGYEEARETICSFQSRTFFFAELDTDHIRDTYNKHLLPLGFKLSEKRWTSGGVELANFLWTNEEYHAVVTSTTRLGEQTAMFYYTQGTPSRPEMTRQAPAHRGARPLAFLA